MSRTLHRLAYFSRNALVMDPAQLDVEIQEILSKSRHNNLRVGVTGALLFNSSCFAQVLEGMLIDVEQTFERIQRDPRHMDVTILEISQADTRAFPGWSMAFAGRVDERSSTFASLTQVLEPSRAEAATTLYSLLQTLVLQEEAYAL